jgi:hypothetical protein
MPWVRTASERVPAVSPASSRISRTLTPEPSTTAWSSAVPGRTWNSKSILSPASGLKAGEPTTGNFAFTAAMTRAASSGVRSATRPTRTR